ncbi:hypothetical protein SAMN04488543_1210 [Friedmanniella luteola]|uniref:Uncharacterized protein n=1 Tax=Friedmanniella luteola TaxID=546871 RepID=A0A1H1Q204_9ACTN|nr:hypothetical protein [Friedmanniella luteola]SDS16989.1 hypothetical protein SAMN04488543_1210 [Friedmanniella luteola]
MSISRRALIGVALGVGGAAVVGAVAFAGPPARPAAAPGRGATYQPGPGDPRLRGPGDMIMEHLPGRWQTHLLPFAGHRPSRARVVADLRAARAQRLVE